MGERGDVERALEKAKHELGDWGITLSKAGSAIGRASYGELDFDGKTRDADHVWVTPFRYPTREQLREKIAEIRRLDAELARLDRQ